MNKRLFAVVWTDRKHRRVKTKKRGAELLRVWKRWYERKGWSVHSLGDGYCACPPGWSDDPLPSARHAIVLHEYDPETQQRVIKNWSPPKEREEKAVETQPRKGRGKPSWA